LRADVVESLIASIYLEGGLDAVRPFIRRYWTGRATTATAARRDAKTELQEWAHREHGVSPAYAVLSREGPDHDPMFTVSVSVGNLKPETADGRSKRIAEQAAASRMLVREKVREDD
jgi:ribonuclease-3